jgi:cytochrome c peroxidase
VLFRSFNARQFWDGRARSLEEQVDGPVQNPQEMGSTWDEVLAKLAQDAGYRQAFHELYGTAPTPDAVRDAIASFERALITPNAPFDRYLRGDARALSAEAAEGWRLFKALGCVSCHQGVNLGGNLYEKLGLVADYFGQRGHITGSDLGRYNLTHNAEHRFEFRVPPLRNVALTAPYLHDGSVQTLEEAVRIMGHHQLGLDLKPAEVRRLVAFLQSLTGQATEAAGLPASTAAAP